MIDPVTTWPDDPLARPPRAAFGRLRTSVALTIAAAMLPAFTALSGCDRGSKGQTKSGSSDRSDRVTPPDNPPEHRVAPGLREKYPDVATFVDEFLAACLVGDYSRYRQLTSRSRNPETKERFQKIYYAIKTVLVESIEPIDAAGVPQPAYLVVSAVDLKPDQKPAAGGANRKIAILVFQEQGEWRMLPAPSEYQPHERDLAPTAPTATNPADVPPEYPWDEGADG